MGSRLKDLAAGPVAMIGAAMERAPSALKRGPATAMEAMRKAGPELPKRIDALRDALPSGRRKKSRLARLKRIVEGAGTAVSVAVTGWEIYELLRARSATKEGSSGSQSGSASRSSGTSSRRRASSGSRRSSSSGKRSSTAKRSSSAGSRSTPSRSTTNSSSRGRSGSSDDGSGRGKRSGTQRKSAASNEAA